MQEKERLTAYEKIRETIIQNKQKGQIYRVKFARDAEVYKGIPIATPNIIEKNQNALEMRVSGSRRDGEILRRSIDEITWMEEA